MSTAASSPFETPPPTEGGLLSFFRRWNADREESATSQLDSPRPTPTWKAPQSFPDVPGPEQVTPTLPHRRLKIECLPSEPAETLPERVKQACHDRKKEGLKLTSTFSHDGSVFLIFKLL